MSRFQGKPWYKWPQVLMAIVIAGASLGMVALIFYSASVDRADNLKAAEFDAKYAAAAKAQADKAEEKDAEPNTSKPNFYPPDVTHVYGKRLIDGTISTVIFHNSEAQIIGGHYVPDYTEVQFDQEGDMDVQSERFCGNVLYRFTPGERFTMVVSENTTSDYTNCYALDTQKHTFGGQPYIPE